LSHQYSFTVPFDTNNTVHPFLCYKYPYSVRSLLTSHPQQLISFAFSSKEPATTTSASCFLNACQPYQLLCLSVPLLIHVLYLSVSQNSSYQPKIPSLLPFISPQVIINTTLCYSTSCAAFWLGFPTSCLHLWAFGGTHGVTLNNSNFACHPRGFLVIL